MLSFMRMAPEVCSSLHGSHTDSVEGERRWEGVSVGRECLWNVLSIAKFLINQKSRHAPGVAAVAPSSTMPNSHIVCRTLLGQRESLACLSDTEAIRGCTTDITICGETAREARLYFGHSKPRPLMAA